MVRLAPELLFPHHEQAVLARSAFVHAKIARLIETNKCSYNKIREVAGMDGFDAEASVYAYIVNIYLIKALDKDREQLRRLKLARAWEHAVDGLLARLTRETSQIRKQMAKHGCRIVLEEIAPGNNVHVMYVHRRYEHHCYMLPYVLKARCEDKLLALWKQAGEPAENLS
jgi:hypothetical protein